MLNTPQCQNPLPVGASGSRHVTAKLLVPSGAPSHRRCGDVSVPPGTPNMPLACGASMRSPSSKSSLTTVNDGTSGR